VQAAFSALLSVALRHHSERQQGGRSGRPSGEGPPVPQGGQVAGASRTGPAGQQSSSSTTTTTSRSSSAQLRLPELPSIMQVGLAGGGCSL